MLARFLNEELKEKYGIHPDRFQRKEVGEMTVYYAKSWYQDVSFALIMTLAGSFFDPKGKKGLAHLTEHMLFTGSEKYTESDIERIGLECGAHFNAGTWQHMVCVYGSPLTRKLEDFLDVLVEVSCHAKPSEEVFKREHKVVQQERQDGEADIDSVMDAHLYRNVFEDCPLSLPVIGTKETIDNIGFSDVEDYLSTYFVPERQIMVIRSFLDWPEVERMLRYHFHGRSVRRIDFSEVANDFRLKPKDSEMLTDFPNVALSYVMPFSLKIPEDGKADILIRMAGSNGMNSILWDILRRKKGLVYGVNSNYCTFMHSPKTLMQVSATFSDTTKIEEVKEDIRETFQNPSLYTKERLEQVILGIESSMASIFMTAAGGTWNLLQSLCIGDTIDFNEMFNRCASVNLSDVREELKRLELWKGRFFVIRHR